MANHRRKITFYLVFNKQDQIVLVQYVYVKCKFSWQKILRLIGQHCTLCTIYVVLIQIEEIFRSVQDVRKTLKSVGSVGNQSANEENYRRI